MTSLNMAAFRSRMLDAGDKVGESSLLLRRVGDLEKTLALANQRIAALSARFAKTEGKVDDVEKRLTGISPVEGGTIRPIIEHVCAHYKISPIDIVSERRTENVALPRHIAMYLAKTMTTCSFPAIGRMFGRRDHTTVLKAVRKIEVEIADDEELAATVAELRAAISENIKTSNCEVAEVPFQ